MSLERILKEPGSERERGAPRWACPGPAAIRPWPFIIALFLGFGATARPCPGFAA